MGDRANIFIRTGKERNEGVFLYTHWGGETYLQTLQDTLALRLCWDDEAYLARMIFSRMTRGSELGETGYGISTHMPDNEHAIAYVDCSTQTVSLCHEKDFPNSYKTFSFEAFCKLRDPRADEDNE